MKNTETINQIIEHYGLKREKDGSIYFGDIKDLTPNELEAAILISHLIDTDKHPEWRDEKGRYCYGVTN
jgi:hypothetical protein